MRGPSRVLFRNLCIEFEAAWDALASTAVSEQTRVSFLFARQAMLLVELASRVASQDPATSKRFAAELQAREPRLFKPIPAYKPGPQARRCVPRVAAEGDPRSDLVTLLFDLMRNGLAHYGHQVYAPLADGRAVGVVLVDSMWRGRTLESVRHGGKTIDHLSCTLQTDGNLVIRVCPAILYLDVRDASGSAGVWDLEADASEFTVAGACRSSASTSWWQPWMIQRTLAWTSSGPSSRARRTGRADHLSHGGPVLARSGESSSGTVVRPAGQTHGGRSVRPPVTHLRRGRPLRDASTPTAPGRWHIGDQVDAWMHDRHVR